MLELGLDAEPDQQTLAIVSAGAHALAYFVIANRRFTDLFDWGQRSVPLSLEAELQHRLLPASYTCEGANSRWPGGWSRRAISAETRSTSASSEKPCISPSLMRWATR